MISKRNLVFISFFAAVVNHFFFYFLTYGPNLSDSFFDISGLIALVSSLILIFVYIGTNWRLDVKDELIRRIFDILVILIIVSYFRSLLNTYKIFSWKELLTSPHVGLSFFPVLFFIVGVNAKYFYMVNKILLSYCILIYFFSLPFITYFELQYFILMPLFYVIATYPLQSSRIRILTFVFSISVFITSITNRAGILRIAISYFIVVIFYFVSKMGISKKLINIFIFLILTIPFYFLYQGIKGKDVFMMVLGENSKGEYGQQNLRADTRTFLYVDVFRELKINKAYFWGKGINAGYASANFETFSRTMAEVGFLQIVLKIGFFGFFVYIIVIISAIFKALNKSKNLFIKYLGLILVGYIVMLFIENIILFNLFNVIIWIIVGMCHSKELRDLNDEEIRALYANEKETSKSN